MGSAPLFPHKGDMLTMDWANLSISSEINKIENVARAMEKNDTKTSGALRSAWQCVV